MAFADFIVEANAVPAIGSEPLDYVLRLPDLARSGLWLEFGVSGGATLRRIAAARGQARVVGFDSFDGLPEAWRPGYPAGSFKTNGPPKIDGVEVVAGLFQDTLPKFVANWLSSSITFLHIDCDLYSSADTVLRHVAPWLTTGAFVVFDELLYYPGFEQHEIKALYEARQRGLAFEWVGRWGEKAAIRIKGEV